jgi:hypothetical protein
MDVHTSLRPAVCDLVYQYTEFIYSKIDCDRLFIEITITKSVTYARFQACPSNSIPGRFENPNFIVWFNNLLITDS